MSSWEAEGGPECNEGRICIFLIFTMPGELQILREVYPERVNCRPFAALRVTANGLRMTGWAVVEKGAGIEGKRPGGFGGAQPS